MQYIPRLLEVKPLVTCSLGGALLAIHFRVLGPLPLLYAADIREVCLMPGAILYDVELLRFITGVLTHISDYVCLHPSPSRCATSPPDCRCGVQQLDTRAPGRQRPLKNPACSVLPLLAASIIIILSGIL